MTERPDLAVKIAQCISTWAEIETLMGMFLALILHANESAVLAMYAGVENRSSQLRMLASAIEGTLPEDHADALTAFINTFIRPSMKYRDKLAHWCWGLADELPDALLIREPSSHLLGLSFAIKAQGERKDIPAPDDRSSIFVIRHSDLDKTLKEFRAVEFNLRVAMASVWITNSEQERAEYLQRLSNEPRIQAGVAKLRKARQKNPNTPPPPPQSDQSGGS